MPVKPSRSSAKNYQDLNQPEELEQEPTEEFEQESTEEKTEIPQVHLLRLREDCLVTFHGHRQTLQAGLVVDTNNYSVASLKKFGAKLDLLDEEGQVKLSLDDISVEEILQLLG